MTAIRMNLWVAGTLILLCVLSGSSPLGEAQEPKPADARHTRTNNSASATDPTAQQIPSVLPEAGPPALPTKQRDKLLKSNFEKMKQDADELTELAKSLQDDLEKSNANVMSVEVIEKAKKIEKLAKKIRSRAKGY